MKARSKILTAGLLFLVFREQDLSRIGNARPHRTITYVGFLIVCLTIFVLLLVKLVMFSGGVAEFLHFVLPNLVIAALLIGREREPTTVGSVRRFSNLLAMAASVVRKAFAISAGLKPQRVLSASAVCASGGMRG